MENAIHLQSKQENAFEIISKVRLHTLMGIVCILATKEIIGTVEQKKKLAYKLCY